MPQCLGTQQKRPQVPLSLNVLGVAMKHTLCPIWTEGDRVEVGWGEAADSSNKTRLVVGVCGGRGVLTDCVDNFGVESEKSGRVEMGWKGGTGERKELWPGVLDGEGSWISTKRVGVGRMGGCFGWGGRWGWRWGRGEWGVWGGGGGGGWGVGGGGWGGGGGSYWLMGEARCRSR